MKIYEKLLNEKLSANLGYLYENVVAQTLSANKNKLFYYTFMNEASRRYLIYTKDFSKNGDVICLPVYMTQFL